MWAYIILKTFIGHSGVRSLILSSSQKFLYGSGTCNGCTFEIVFPLTVQGPIKCFNYPPNIVIKNDSHQIMVSKIEILTVP